MNEIKFTAKGGANMSETFYDFFDRSIRTAPYQFLINPEKCCIAIPTMFWNMVSRHVYLMAGRTPQNTDIERFYGFKILPGYEMAIVIFFPNDTVLNPEMSIHRVEITSNEYFEVLNIKK